MKKNLLISIFIIVFFSACSIKPQAYDLSTKAISPVLNIDKNIPSFEITNFKYKPNIKISQHTTSMLGCFPCKADGSSPGTLYAEPISEIIKAEVKNAFNEIMIGKINKTCQLTATIHLVGFDIMDGDSSVDLTYYLLKNKNTIFKRRVKGHYNAELFDPLARDRLYSKASRNSVEKLVNQSDFLEIINTKCMN